MAPSRILRKFSNDAGFRAGWLCMLYTVVCWTLCSTAIQLRRVAELLSVQVMRSLLDSRGTVTSDWIEFTFNFLPRQFPFCPNSMPLPVSGMPELACTWLYH